MKKPEFLLLAVFWVLLFYTAHSYTVTPTVGDINDPYSVTEDIGLPVLGSKDKLISLLTQEQKNRETSYYKMAPAAPERAALTSTASMDMAKAESGYGGSSDYSATNTQVTGVDEADVVKTDGTYIYQVNNRRIIVLEAFPAAQMKMVSTVKFTDENFWPQEIYVDDQYLTVIGSSHQNVGSIEPSPATMEKKMMDRAKPGIYPGMMSRSTLKAIIFDITSKADIKQVREVELEGGYVSSRKIGKALYLVANKYIDYYYIQEQQQAVSAPVYRDTNAKDDYVSIDYKDIRYFPQAVEPNYLMIAGVNLDRPHEEMKVSTYLGSGHNIYVSEKSLYVAVTQYDQVEHSESATTTAIGIRAPAPAASKTVVYRFTLEDGAVNFVAQGSVPGTILNQFSMDEHRDHFRIATTAGEVWRNDEFTSKNNLYILNNKMNTVGKIENIAPGERIYSVRFMGDRGYMVTFKTVDPLFVLDLANPSAPKILGELKIPGYSDYLHPYDENHLIGFGKDAIEVMVKNWEGKSEPMAFHMGMKIAIFDVSDVANPKEKFVEYIGDRGTYSELLHNHKALLFAGHKNLLAFPVAVHTVKGSKYDSQGYPAYGELTFQGAYVYHLDLEQGFTLKQKISHLTSEELSQANYRGYDYRRNLERLLYIDNTLYTLSQGMVKAHDLGSFDEIKAVKVPE